MDYFRIIMLNCVPLLVYKSGEIYRIKHNNYYSIPNRRHSCGYNHVKLNNKLFYRHRILGYAFLNLEIENTIQYIDHVDGNKINNDIRNLRRVTPQENAFNQPRSKGYTFDPINKIYKAYIHLNSQYIHLGNYKTETEARDKYLEAKKKYHVINFYS